jgi:hypothetical protein
MHPIKECLELDLSGEEFMAYALIMVNSTNERSKAETFVRKHGVPSPVIVEKLVKMDLVQAPFKSEPPYSYYDVIILKKGKERILELADELWDAYPATFPLSNGGMFVARTGSKDIVLQKYLNIIDWSETTHKEVMIQLKRYIKAVNAGKINGCKFSDWVDSHMWNTMKDIPDQDIEVSVFKVDI